MDDASLTVVGAIPEGKPSPDSQTVTYGNDIASVTINATDDDSAASGFGRRRLLLHLQRRRLEPGSADLADPRGKDDGNRRPAQ